MSDFKLVSILNPTVVLTAGPIISAGTQSQVTGTVVFGSSAGNITFGMSNGYVTGSAPAGGAGGNTLTVSAANGTFQSNAITFANSNGLSFSTGTQGVYGTVKTDYLTTAMVSNAGSNFAGLGFTGTNATGTMNSNGLQISVAAPGGGGGAAISAGANSQNTGTVNFSNANGVTFGLSNNGVMTASVAAAGGAQTGISGISAGTQLQTVGTIQFLDSNGVTFGMSNSSQITATVKTDYQSSNANYLTSQSNQAVSAGTQASSTFQTLSFANSNGVSWSTGTQGLYATVATNYQSQGAYLTTARASNDAIGLNTALTANGVSMTANSSGLSLNFPAFLTSQSNPAVSGANGSFTFQTATFANSNGVSFSTGTQGLYATVATNYQSQGAYLTTARASNDAIGLNTAQTNVTWTVNSSGISLNAGGYAGTSTGFTGANISGSMTNNSAGLALSLSVAAPGGGAFAAGVSTDAVGTTGTVGNQIVFFEGANITLSQSVNGGSASLSIVGAAGGGGAGYTDLVYSNQQLDATATLNMTNDILWLVPMRLVAPLSASTIMQMISFGGASSTNTGSVGATIDMALYKNTAATNSSRMDSIWSSRYAITYFVSSNTSAGYTISGGASGQNRTTASANVNLNTQFNGARMITFNLNTVLDAGLYAFGLRCNSSSVGNSAGLRTFQHIVDSPLPFVSVGDGFGAAANTNIGFPEAGSYGTTTAAFPASFLLSDIKVHSNIIHFVKLGAA